MESNEQRTFILNKIKKALGENEAESRNADPGQSDFFVQEEGDLEDVFKRKLSQLQGCFVKANGNTLVQTINRLSIEHGFGKLCCSIPDIIPSLKLEELNLTEDLTETDVAITNCECLVARTGSVVVSSAQASGRRLPVFAPVHMVIAYTTQLYYDTGDALRFLLDKYDNQLPSSLHFVAGPSRTGDIEKTLVMGIHGPKKVFVLLIEK